MVLGALALRLFVTCFSYHAAADPVRDHEQFGAEMAWTARSIALGHGFSSPFMPTTGPTALVPPLFPYLLAGIFKIFGLYSKASAFAILALDSLFSALTCIPLYLSVRKSLGPRAARWAGWGWAVHPFAIYYCAAIVWDYALSSLLFATCFLALLGLDERKSVWKWTGCGLLCGFSVLSNPSILLVLLLLFIRAAWLTARRNEAWLARTLAGVLALVAVLVPWTVRNYRVLHVVTPVRDGFWLECFAGNAGDSSKTNPGWAHPASNPVEMRAYIAMGEVAYMQEKKTLTTSFIENHPLWFAEVSARRFLRYWTGFWSFRLSYLKDEPLDIPNVFFCTTLTIFAFLGAVRWIRFGPKTYVPYLIAVLVFPLPYYVTHASMDYRQPIETVIVALIVAYFALRPERPVLEALSEE